MRLRPLAHLLRCACGYHSRGNGPQRRISLRFADVWQALAARADCETQHLCFQRAGCGLYTERFRFWSLTSWPRSLPLLVRSYWLR